MYFDSHAHLTEDCFAQDFDSIVENMKAASVTGMMEIGFDLPSSEKAVQLAERFSWVHAAVGSHPDDAAQVDEARIAVYRELCKKPRVKAIGEIGLDYHYEDPPRDVQQRAFRLQMALAQELSMPVVIHERKAHEDGLRIIDEFPDVKGVFHCFSYDVHLFFILSLCRTPEKHGKRRSGKRHIKIEITVGGQHCHCLNRFFQGFHR